MTKLVSFLILAAWVSAAEAADLPVPLGSGAKTCRYVWVEACRRSGNRIVFCPIASQPQRKRVCS